MIRVGQLSDVNQLVNIENRCFDSDRVNRRGFRYFITKGRAVLLVSEEADVISGYILILFRRGTLLARIYSIAVDWEYRKTGIAKSLVYAGEEIALENDAVTMRLEIRDDNTASIRLFEGLGYRRFGRSLKYYEDESDALRFEKRLIKKLPPSFSTVPFYRQTLDFTCGPAALMMAMNALDERVDMSRHMELRLWCEATSISR